MFVVLALIMFLLTARGPPDRGRRGIHPWARRPGQDVACGNQHPHRLRVHCHPLVARPSSPGRRHGLRIYVLLDDRLDEGIVAVLGASLLFILPTNWKERRATLT
jgi:sodium-dependent dicarboxylate transporter 2/3/5